MPDFLIRNLDEETMRRLKERADKHGRSMQAEIKDTLKRSLKLTHAEALAEAHRMQAETRGRDFGDVVAGIREDRASR